MKKLALILAMLLVSVSLYACDDGKEGTTPAATTAAKETAEAETREEVLTKAETTEKVTTAETATAEETTTVATTVAETTTAEETTTVATTVAQTTDYDTLEGILAVITSDFTATRDKLTTELENVKNAIGDTYSGYEQNTGKISDFYSLCIDETEKLYERTWENSVKYYKLVASSVDHNDHDAIDDATENFYETVYEDAFDDLYEAIYEDAFDTLYDDYYEGIIEDAEDSMEYKDWVDVRSGFYKDWVDVRSDFYKGWVDARSDLYKDYVDIRKEFIYDDNFDVDDILNTGKK